MCKLADYTQDKNANNPPVYERPFAEDTVTFFSIYVKAA